MTASNAASLPVPVWAELVGGTDEAAWVADRDRKFRLATALRAEVLSAKAAIEGASGDLFVCTPQALAAHPFAADWYISLSAYALKTLGNIHVRPKSYGLDRSAKGVVESIRRGHLPSREDQLAAFCRWINAEIDHLWPSQTRSAQAGLGMVLMIVGGRVIGQGQNIGGNEAADFLKNSLVEAMQGRSCTLDIENSDGAWAKPSDLDASSRFVRFRVNGRLVVDFAGGGNNPDIVLQDAGRVVAVGEIKGRKDLSNAWESWMPQVVDHMRSWHVEYPKAATVFFATLITEGMVEGRSERRDAPRGGLKSLFTEGFLTSAFNLGLLAVREPHAVDSFEDFADYLLAHASE